MHHLPEDLRTRALTEMQRVLRPGGRVLVAEAQSPRHGLGWRLLARLHGYDRMARKVPHLERQLAVVPGTSHALPMEKPDVANRLVLDFLASEQVPKIARPQRYARGAF